MTAAVKKNVDFAVLIPAHYHRPTPDKRGFKVARIPDLTLMADENPAFTEYIAHFCIENLFVRIDRPMHTEIALVLKHESLCIKRCLCNRGKAIHDAAFVIFPSLSGEMILV